MISRPYAGCHDPNSGVTPSAANPVSFSISARTAYVTNFVLGTVTPIRTATNTALPSIKTGRSAVTIVITTGSARRRPRD
jgi:hypothetical protein